MYLIGNAYNMTDEYPTDEELPDNPVSADELNPFSVDEDNFDDINEFATAEWVEQTTDKERILTVIKRLEKPVPVTEIANKAVVPESICNSKLETMVDNGSVEIHTKNSKTVYKYVK